MAVPGGTSDGLGGPAETLPRTIADGVFSVPSFVLIVRPNRELGKSENILGPGRELPDAHETLRRASYHHFIGLNFWTLRPQSVSAT
jgi:hypothetical protein